MKHELVSAGRHRERTSLVDAARWLDDERLDRVPLEPQIHAARTVERRQLEAEGCDDRPDAGVHDRPRRVGSHPSPRPLRIVLARKEPRHRCGIEWRRDRQHLSIVETCGDTQSVRGRAIGKRLSAGGVTPHEQMRVTIRHELLGQMRVGAVADRATQQRHAIARQPLN